MAISANVLVSSAGTPVPLGSGMVNCPVAIKAMHANTGLVAVCDPAVTLSEGYHLNKDEYIILHVSSLENVYIDSAVDGEGVNYILLNV